MNFTPHFTARDYENMFPIRANRELNDGEGGFQVLYSEIEFPFIAAKLAEEGNEAYAYGYDGYTFYQTMSWAKDSVRAAGLGRGLFTAILDPPGYLGWVCYRNAEGEYDCKSQYLVAGGLDDKTAAPDLLKDDYNQETGWMCKVDTESSDVKDIVECVYFMPSEAEEYERGQMRWQTHTLQTDLALKKNRTRENIPQVGFIGRANPTDNQWLYLGIVEFQGAITLVGAAIASMAAILTF